MWLQSFAQKSLLPYLLLCAFSFRRVTTDETFQQERGSVRDRDARRKLLDNRGTNERSSHVALLTAGALRSFAFVAESWNRYLFRPQLALAAQERANLYLFAHAITQDSSLCPIAAEAIQTLKLMATAYEISNLQSKKLRVSDWPRSSPDSFNISSKFQGYIYKTQFSLRKGNVVDMYDRRARSYSLAKNYSVHHKIDWDLIIFLRSDTAVYSPAWPFKDWIRNLQARMMEGIRAVFSPTACNFVYGTCDRLTIGLPEEMENILVYDFVFSALSWISTSDHEHASFARSLHRINSLSEFLMRTTLAMGNMTQLNPDPVISFLTLRTVHADRYCRMVRTDFVNLHRTHRGDPMLPDKSDVVTAIEYRTSKATGFDLVASATERCGRAPSLLNVTQICLGSSRPHVRSLISHLSDRNAHYSCDCGVHGRPDL